MLSSRPHKGGSAEQEIRQTDVRLAAIKKVLRWKGEKLDFPSVPSTSKDELIKRITLNYSEFYMNEAEAEVTLRLTVSQSVRVGVEPHCGTRDLIFILS
jgi:hypothetical protein